MSIRYFRLWAMVHLSISCETYNYNKNESNLYLGFHGFVYKYKDVLIKVIKIYIIIEIIFNLTSKLPYHSLY